MSNTFVNWTSRVAVAEWRRPHPWNELTILGDYRLPSARPKPGQKPRSGSVRFKQSEGG
jgi:hypothetical protein